MKRYLFLIFAAMGILAVSCSQDRVTPQARTAASDEVSVHFRIRMPKPVTVATRAESNPECVVNWVALMAFSQEDGEGEFLYRYTAMGKNLSQVDNVDADFEAMLLVNADSVKLLAVANYPGGLFNSIPVESTEAEVRDMLTGVFITSPVSGGLPMSGAKGLSSISEETGTIKIPMLRSISKITIEKALRAGTPDLTITEAYLYRSSDKWQYFPDAGAVRNEAGENSTTPLAIYPSIPADAEAATAPEGLTVASDETVTAYLTENAANYIPDETTCIVVGGKFDGSDEITYYRLDIGSDEDPDHPFGQSLRNFWYQFTVVEVRSAGWPTPDDAADNPVSGLVADVMPWNGGDNSEYHFGKNRYVILNQSEMLLGVNAGDKAVLYITTSELPFTIASDLSFTAGPLDTSNPTQTLETDLMTFTIEEVEAPEDGQQRWKLTATANTDDFAGDYLNLTAIGELMNIRILVRRAGELSIERISELETVPISGTVLDGTGAPTAGFVEYKVDIPEGMEWSAEFNPVVGTASDGRQLVHHGLRFTDAAGNDLVAGQLYPSTTTILVVAPKVYYPNRDIPIAVDVTVTVSGNTGTFTVGQDVLTSAGVVGFSLRDASPYGMFGNGSYNATYEQWLEEEIEENQDKTYTYKDSNYRTGASLPMPTTTNFLRFIARPTDATANSYDWTSVNTFIDSHKGWFDIRADYIYALTILNKASSPLKINGYPDIARSGLYEPGVFTTMSSTTKVYSYLTNNGLIALDPATITGEFSDDMDCTHIPIPTEGWPASGVVMLLRSGTTNQAKLVIDVENGLMFQGGSQLFDNDMTGGRGTFLRNLLHFEVNAALYGSHFTDLLLEGDNGGVDPRVLDDGRVAQPAPWDTAYWGANAEVN